MRNSPNKIYELDAISKQALSQKTIKLSQSDIEISTPALSRNFLTAMGIKFFQTTVVLLVLLIELAVASPTWAKTAPSPDYFEVGQKVIWLYKARGDSTDIQRIPAEVVKLGSKEVQIKVHKNKNEFVNRWVNPNKLENSQQ
ncbi:hypothetical protein IQ276_025225 [Desmonostoc muscorum LEGE 12446]|uniref:hypothetical protein n=1 Tax=Desmonostoc muscorum TaxID=1179 RepID=UPI001D148AAB|nr:hypothetical protein [Desmonostoc muscorum]MCF2149674.1 hypothetical protein [Desmonostoc muscorum LEGE 12446]